MESPNKSAVPASKDNVEVKPKDEKPKQQQEKFSKGDYSVHVYIEETKGLLPASGENESNPVISLTCFGKTKSTKKQKNVGTGATSVWNEHIYFYKLGCSVSDIESEKIIIHVTDTNTIKDTLIGSYEMDLTYIYFQTNHSIIHQWIILTNPYLEDISVMRGLVKLGINVTNEDDKPEDLTNKNITESLSVPPQVKLKTVQLVIQFLKAENLPIMDKLGTIDAYCLVKFGGAECSTTVVTADKINLSVYWLDEILLPVIRPSISNKISITIYDKDLGSSDDLVGSLTFYYDTLEENPDAPFCWYNIYGAPQNITNSEADEMNMDESIASHWRGRLLLRLFIKNENNPVVKRNKIETKEIKTLLHQTYEIENNYLVLAQVYEGANLPDVANDYSIIVKFAQLKIQTKEAKSQTGCCRWYESLRKSTIGIPEGALLPDIFIYLVKGDSEICYARIPADQCKDILAKPKWIKLTPDKAIGKVKNPWEGGYVLLRVFVDLLDKPGLKSDSWKAKLDLPVKSQTKKLVCNLYQCKSLPASDSNGLADPYVKGICGPSSFSTDPKAKSGILNPMWYKQYTLDVNYPSVEFAPPVIIQVWDYDKGLDSDDLMGFCKVDIAEIPLNPPDFPRPTWKQLSLGTEDTEEGKILIGLALYDLNIPPLIMPVSILVSVDIYALGLRDLKPALGWLPVNKPFIKIDLKAITFPGESLLITDLSTQPGSCGPNPNLAAILSFKCKIPQDPLYCPSLSCNVYDYLMSGLSQPLIGTFTIDLNKFFKTESKSDTKIEAIIKEQVHNLEILDQNKKTPAENSESQPLIKTTSVAPEDTLTGQGTLKKTFLSLSEAQEPGKVVIMPQFKEQENGKKPVENKLIDESYVPLGYNRTPNDNCKHYRYILDSTLEKSNLFGEPPFQSYTITKGQSRGLSRDILSILSKVKTDDTSTLRQAGTFKGIVKINYSNSEEIEKKQEPGLEILPQNVQIQDTTKKITDPIAKLLVTKNDCLVRIYILDALNLEQKDADSASDPYLRIKLGSNIISDRDNYIKDCANPKFYRCFELNTSFPGESTLKVQLWDKDDFLPDQKIGATKIDLEDRFFNSTWASLQEKPIEIRKLQLKSCKRRQGVIRMWVEIYKLYQSPPRWDISQRPPEKIELRIIIWKSADVPNADIEGVSDLYVVCSINSERKKETDTHFRAQEGVGSWNWRIKYDLLVDQNTQTLLNIEMMDRDILSSNDVIGDASIDLTALVLQVYDTGEPAKKYGTSDKLLDRVQRRENESFWVDLIKTTEKGQKGTGKLLISIEILPEKKALACINGEGRNEPNVEPFLPKPEGRIKLSLNPFAMFNQMVGPELRRKIYCYLCSIVCLALLAFTMPTIFGNLVTNLFI